MKSGKEGVKGRAVWAERGRAWIVAARAPWTEPEAGLIPQGCPGLIPEGGQAWGASLWTVMLPQALAVLGAVLGGQTSSTT